MRYILGPLGLLIVFIVRAILLTSPLLLIAFLARKRMDRRYIRGLVALGFAASTAHFLYRMEWFDVWRHGVPPISLILVGYVPWISAVALVGWWLGGLIAPRPVLRR